MLARSVTGRPVLWLRRAKRPRDVPVDVDLRWDAFERAETADAGPALPEPAAANEGETILVVEDEGLVRMLMVQTLEDKGYRVIEAHDAQGAMLILESDMKVDLLATDVGLPGMNGRQLAEAARALRPDLSVLFLTGYAHNAALGDEPLGPRTQLISKPFAVKTMLAKIRSMLEDAAE